MIDTITHNAPRLLFAAGQEVRGTWRLHFVTASACEDLGRIYSLPPGRTVFGRATNGTSDHAEVIDDLTMSRSHLALAHAPGVDFVDLEDLGSRNGTFVDGKKVTHARLGNGAVLRFGAVVAVLELDRGRHLDHGLPTAGVPGRSESARIIRGELTLAARDALPALLTGATGTGKEFAGGELHRLARPNGPLVRVNVTAVPESMFEAELFGHMRGAFTGAMAARPGRIREAQGGTLILDEIGDLSLQLQPKLLRVLEEGTIRPIGGSTDVAIDVRFVASTNADLDDRVLRGLFRRDLAARFRCHIVVLPPIASRRADLLDLAEAVHPAPAGKTWRHLLSPLLIERLLQHHWPDNLRDLRAILVRIAAGPLDPPAGLTALPPAFFEGARGATEAFRPDLVQTGPIPVRGQQPQGRPSAEELHELLEMHRGNIDAIATTLGRHRRQVYRWLDYAGIDGAAVDRYRGKA